MNGLSQRDHSISPSTSLSGIAMLSQRGTLAMLILVELLAFSFMSETVVFPAIVSLAAIFGWQRPQRFYISADRQVILALLIGLLFVVGWRVNPHRLPDDTMVYLSPFLHSLGQYLLVLQTAALYIRHERDVMPITLPWPGVFVMLSAGDINATESQRATFQVVAILFMATMALYFSATADATAGRFGARNALGKRAAIVIVLLAMACAAWIGSTALHRYERELNRIVSTMLAPTVGSSGAGFPSDSELGSISERKTSQADDIALRIQSPHRPGYWRGRIYHWLDDPPGVRTSRITRWEHLPPPEFAKTGHIQKDRVLRPDGQVGTLHRYTLHDAPRQRPSPKFGVWLEPPQWGVYFLPAGAVEILTTDEYLISDYRQTISPRHRSVVHYSVSTAEKDADDALIRPQQSSGAFSVAALTTVPNHSEIAGGDRDVQALARRIFADCKTFDDRITAVESYFRSNYQYHVGIDVPSGVDPIEWFLIEKPNAHCEFFAQGAALLLRMGGIPTRYVTGFVVAERNNYGEYWLARNEDAHAWCEAWDPQRGWVLVEATPAAGIPTANQTAWHQQAWEYFRGAIDRFRFRFAEGGWLWLGRQIWQFLRTPAGWLVLMLILGYIGLRTRMLLAARSRRSLPPLVIDLHRLLRRMDRRMERSGLTRASGETLTRFARRIATETGNRDAAQWYASYAAARYGGDLNEARITSLREQLNTNRFRHQ